MERAQPRLLGALGPNSVSEIDLGPLGPRLASVLFFLRDPVAQPQPQRPQLQGFSLKSPRGPRVKFLLVTEVEPQASSKKPRI